MRNLRFDRRSVLAVCALALTAATVPAADAAPRPVALGEVSMRVDKPSPELSRAFRSAVRSELDRVDLSGVKASDQYVLSATLTNIETRSEKGQTESRAVVSATLRRARGGALHAVINGRAQAIDGPRAAELAELSAMRGAVHSAIKRLPEAIK